MQKTLLATLAFVMVIGGRLPGEDTVKILSMEIPANAAAGANTLLVDLTRLQALGEELTAAMEIADIVLLKEQAAPVITLGSLKKGRLKWDHKTFGSKFLAVKFVPADFAVLAQSIRSKSPRPGFQIAACDSKTQAVIKSIAVTFSDFADLVVQLNYPVKAVPGQSLQQEVSVNLENKGSVAAKSVNLQIVLSGDDMIPLRRAPESAMYGEDILVENGSEIIPALEPGQIVTVKFSGSLKIPDDTPPGEALPGRRGRPGKTASASWVRKITSTRASS